MPQERGGNLRVPSAGRLQLFTVLEERGHQVAYGPAVKLGLQRDDAELKGNKSIISACIRKADILMFTTVVVICI